MLLGAGLLMLAPSLPAQAAVTTPPVRTGLEVQYTLYGSAGGGWGFNATNESNPGPHLYVNYGDTVQLTLIATDQANHNWFIDYDNSTTPSTGEPSSPQFTATNSILWNFTADRIGTYVYRCEIHPISMTGFITISTPTHYTLYGDAQRGWGLNATNITNPGPTLVVQAGANVSLTLYAADSTFHSWFIDYQNATGVSSGDPNSPYFGSHYSSPVPNPLNWSFTADRAGTFIYRCSIHLTTMTGVILVLGTSTGPASTGLPIGLIPGIMLVVIGGVLILAVVYQIRASRAARLKK